MAAADLPDECWEHVFKFLTSKDNNDSDNERDYKLVMKSLSVVSKEFLSITNRLRYSLAIHTQTRDRLYERLPILFQRFPNITSLDLSHYRIITGHPSYGNDLNNVLLQISQFPLKLTSFTFSRSCTIPTNGLRSFSQKITTLTSLTCSDIDSITSNDIFLIADCFPLLEELDLSYSYSYFTDSTSIPSIVEPLSLVLFKLRKVNLFGHDYINDKLLFHLFKNCKLLEEVSLFHCLQLTDAGIASALLERPTLKSLSFGTLQDWTMLSAFTRNCPSLSEMKVQHCMRRVNNVENFNSFVVSPQLKSLRFVCNCWLTKETIKVFALFPNLARLDLRCYNYKSEVFMCQILRICCKLRHLNLSDCLRLKVYEMNFEVPKLEVLNLTETRVDDKALHVISKSCCGLLQLILQGCCNVTERGVNHVVENCTQLRMIDLRNCFNVDADVAALILLSRPSRIKIIAPRRNRLSNKRGDSCCCQM
jgi:hypothetical protein